MTDYKPHHADWDKRIHPGEVEKWKILLRTWRKEVRQTFAAPAAIITKIDVANNIYPPMYATKERWTSDEEAYLIANHSILSNARIAYNLRRSLPSINLRIQLLRNTGKMSPSGRAGQEVSDGSR